MCETVTTDKVKDCIYKLMRPEIRKLAMLQEQKFLLHDKKRGNPFDCENLQFMKDRLHEETNEMYRAMKTGQTPNTVWKEAADRCNFILMQAVNYEREYGEKKNV
jgi:hypothetical protein